MKQALMTAAVLVMCGCKSAEPIPDPEPPVIEKPDPPRADLPTNPQTGPDLPGSISEQWSLKRKDYDGTYRITWPSTFASDYGIGEGSYCTVGDHRAAFRGIDADHGARRPKYTLPQSKTFALPVTCILYNSQGEAVGWFEADRVGTNGRLP